jgi:hypothetical protein
MSADAVRVALMERFAALLRAPTHEELAEASGVPVGEIPGVLREMHEQHLLVLRPGTDEILMAAPFSAVPTDYVAVVNGRRHFGNCIWDALGVVAMLGGIGRVEKVSEDLRVECAIRRVSAPREYVVHFAVPASQWWEDIAFT